MDCLSRSFATSSNQSRGESGVYKWYGDKHFDSCFNERFAWKQGIVSSMFNITSSTAAIYKPVVHLTMSSALNNSVLYSRVDNIGQYVTINDHSIYLVEIQQIPKYNTFLLFTGHCYSNIACLRWDSPLEEYREAFHYVKDGYNLPVAIQVRSAGTYNVYAQLAINGNDQR